MDADVGFDLSKGINKRARGSGSLRSSVPNQKGAGKEYPLDIWLLVLKFTPVDPLAYTSWAHVCQKSRQVFFQDSVWRKFSPVECESNLAVEYHKRIAKLDANELSFYRQLWREVLTGLDERINDEENMAWRHTKTAIVKSAFLEREFYFTYPDFALIAFCWMHMFCPLWHPMDVRRSKFHIQLVRKRMLRLQHPDALMVCLARLYGPMVRYLPDQLLDSLSLAREVAGYDLGASPADYDDEWVAWQQVPQIDMFSADIQKDPEFQQLMLRWTNH